MNTTLLITRSLYSFPLKHTKVLTVFDPQNRCSHMAQPNSCVTHQLFPGDFSTKNQKFFLLKIRQGLKIPKEQPESNWADSGSHITQTTAQQDCPDVTLKIVMGLISNRITHFPKVWERGGGPTLKGMSLAF